MGIEGVEGGERWGGIGNCEQICICKAQLPVKQEAAAPVLGTQLHTRGGGGTRVTPLGSHDQMPVLHGQMTVHLYNYMLHAQANEELSPKIAPLFIVAINRSKQAN